MDKKNTERLVEIAYKRHEKNRNRKFLPILDKIRGKSINSQIHYLEIRLNKYRNEVTDDDISKYYNNDMKQLFRYLFQNDLRNFFSDINPNDEEFDFELIILQNGYNEIFEKIDTIEIINLIENKIEELKGIDKQTEAGAAETYTPELEKISHRISLMDELGIFEHLQTKYPILRESNPSAMVKVLSEFMGIEPKQFDTWRKSIGYLNTKHQKDPKQTKTAMNKVNGVLSKLGLKDQ